MTPNRREFLAGSAALAAQLVAPAKPPTAKRCVMIGMAGGPSHLDTFDPKPDAPSEVRGPFHPIRTRVPGVVVSELFPLLADRLDRCALLRGVHHDLPPLHEVGLQLLQTGQFAPDGSAHPNIGSRFAERGSCWMLPRPLGEFGLNLDRGQSGAFEQRSPGEMCDFGVNCHDAIVLLERGASFVGINTTTRVHDTLSWDCHADGGRLATTLDDYRDVVAPEFDLGFAILLDGLRERGLLDSTLVVACGEFGRTPYLNPRGGRDHWAGCWTAILAGGGVQGGAVYGRSDDLGGAPADGAVTPADIAATVLHAGGFAVPFAGRPIREVF